eukprot:scaffold70838_cov82-Phaeocystis_antarctica.AAC.2
MLQGCSHATRRRFPSKAAQRSPTAGWVPLCRCTAARAVRWRPGGAARHHLADGAALTRGDN